MNVTVNENANWDSVKTQINPDITELTIPLTLIENDLSYLSNFPKLEILKLTGYNILTKEQLDILSKTNIKEIDTVMLPYIYDNLLSETNTVLVGGQFNILIYKGIIIRDAIKKLESNTDDYIKIRVNSLNKENLETLFRVINTSGIEEILIEDYNKKEYKINIEKNNTVNLIVNTPIEALKFYNYFNNKGITVDTIKIKLDDKNKYGLDYGVLEDLNKKVKLKLSYENGISDATLEEFTSLQESIKWYRKLITDANLSPTEKLMYVYDILKTFEYKSSEECYDSRDPHRIIETGFIVCRGYAALLNEIINGVDTGISSINVDVTVYDKEELLGSHSRNVVRIDDEKYNIHGLFVIDATWDSVKTDEESLKILGSDYTALDLYRYFLIPYNDYKKTFGNDTIPSTFDKFLYDEDITKLFNKKVSDEIVTKYINTKRPSLDEFKTMVYNVGLSEGYTSIDALKEVEKIEEINRKAIEEAHKNGSSIEFFENHIRKSA